MAIGGNGPHRHRSLVRVTVGTVLLVAHTDGHAHDTGRGHPERPARLDAVLRGVGDAGVGDALVSVTPRAATRAELEAVHSAGYLDAVEAFCHRGGGALDPDTVASPGSWETAVVAAGAGIDASERLRAGEADAAFIAVRPPGHHATRQRAMGFCLINNVAVTAAAVAGAGERVLIVDYDAHHGNGTQDAFWSDPRVMYVSLHQWPFYPGTGAAEDTGAGAGAGSTVNFPLPAGATGDVYLSAFDEVIAPVAERFKPTWVVISAGFDGHRADPLCGMALASGDFNDLTARICDLVPAGRRLVVLEGGYDLTALADSAGSCVAALAGEGVRSEAATNGGPGGKVVETVRRIHLPDG